MTWMIFRGTPILRETFIYRHFNILTIINMGEYAAIIEKPSWLLNFIHNWTFSNDLQRS